MVNLRISLTPIEAVALSKVSAAELRDPRDQIRWFLQQELGRLGYLYRSDEVENFDEEKEYQLDLLVPEDVIESWNLKDGTYALSEVLDEKNKELTVSQGRGKINVKIGPLESRIFVMK